MDLGNVMSGLAANLDSISGLRTYAYPPDSVSVPGAVVAFPDEIEFDTTMARGSDRIELPVHVLIGKVSDRTSATRLAAYLSGSGASSIKAAVEADKTLNGSADTTRVMKAEVTVMTLNGVDYLAATFTIEVIA